MDGAGAMRYTVRPISDRTPFTGKHATSQFTATWSDALTVLERELGHLGAKEIVLEIDVLESAIRLDGQIRADARAADPAVRLAFESKLGDLVYATDRFVCPLWQRKGMGQDWQHNLYAIALGLEALRKVDRYGITKRGEQYTGWKALPPGGIAVTGGMTADQALAVIDQFTPKTKLHEPLEQKVRWAKAGTHPDRYNGDRSHWDSVERAIRVLERDDGRLA